MSYKLLGRGMRVEVRDLGPGNIIRPTKIGAVVSLDEYDGLEIEITVERITPLEMRPNEPSQNTQPDANIQPEITRPILTPVETSLYTSARSLEALRFGLVPEQHIEMLTVGFESLRDWVLSCFPESRGGNPNAFEISGPFGTGKSHTMAVIRYLAKKAGYLTARVEVDGQIVSLAEPGKLLNNLWSTLSGPEFESSTPLLDLYLKAIDKGHQAPVLGNTLGRIRDNFLTIQTLKRTGLIEKYSHEVESILSSSEEFSPNQVNVEIGREPSVFRSQINLRSLLGRKVGDRPAAFLESVVGHSIVAKLAGFKGLIITIDEFEVETAFSNTRSRMERSGQIINILTDYFIGTTGYPKAPFSIFIASVGQDGNMNDTVIQAMIEETGGDSYPLDMLDTDQRVQLAEKIHRLYCETYSVDLQFNRNLATHVEKALMSHGYDDDSGFTRAFIKLFVGMLDMQYGPPGGSN